MSTDEEAPAIACPKCKSLNTLEALEFEGVEQRHTCMTCGHQWTVAEPVEGAGPWRVGRKVGRTVYLADQLCGLMDSAELAETVVTAANACCDLFNDTRMAELKDLAARAEDTLKGKSRGHVPDAEAFATFIVDLKARVDKLFPKEEGD